MGPGADEMLTVGSLFSGIGGFDLGLERAGLRVAWQCEKDEGARRVLARRWPDVTCYPDVKDLDGREPTVDVLCGGFPCQDLSVAGRRAGLAGERSGLFHEFMRVAAELAPRWVLVENVPGLLSSNDGRDMGVVLGVLADLGYGWCYRVLDAQWFGVAQRRRRVFIVGCLGDARRAGEVLLESSCCDGDSAPSREAGEGVASDAAPSIAHSLRAQGQLAHREDVDTLILAPALTARYGKGIDSGAADALLPISVGRGSDTLYAHDLAQPITGRHADPGHVAYPLAMRGRDDGAELEMGDPDPYNALRAGDGGSSRQNLVMFGNWAGPAVGDRCPGCKCSWDDHDEGGFCAGPCGGNRCGGQPMAFAENQRGEVLETPYSRQLTAGGGKPGQGYPAVRDGMAVRRLMPVECERLQGFPDGWTADETDSARYRMLGNAICVPVAQWIGQRLAEVA